MKFSCLLEKPRRRLLSYSESDKIKAYDNKKSLESQGKIQIKSIAAATSQKILLTFDLFFRSMRHTTLADSKSSIHHFDHRI